MNFNNTWMHNEDEQYLMFGCNLNVRKEDYKNIVFNINMSLHELTLKYNFLMTLSSMYCEHFGINYVEDYKKFLTKNEDDSHLFQTTGYKFYKKGTPNRVSKVFFVNEEANLDSKFLHYIMNGTSGNPELIENTPNIENLPLLHKYSYDFSPLNVLSKPNYSENINGVEIVNIGFSIESHISIWLDETPNFRYYDENNKLQLIELSNNRNIAYRNTPRLNSFLREIRELIQSYGGQCALYDYKSLLDLNNQNRRLEGLGRKGIPLDNRIIYQEDIDNGYVNMETYEWIGPLAP